MKYNALWSLLGFLSYRLHSSDFLPLPKLEAVESKRTSGLVFGATSVENELFFAHAGLRVLDDPLSGPMTEDSILWICSQTKMIASIAAFQLIEAGKLSLDTDVTEILPELANPVIVGQTPTGQAEFRTSKSVITIRHLLNHSSGLDYGPEINRVCKDFLPTPYTTYHAKQNPIQHFLDQRKGMFPTQPLKAEPGTDFGYGYGPDVVGFIVERITGQNLEDYFKEHIFLPLGITAASFYLTPDLKERAVSMSYREPDGTVVPLDDQIPLTIQDPTKAGIAVNPILTSASVETFFQPTLHPLAAETLNDYLKMKGQQWSTALCLTTVDMPGRRRKGSAWWWGWAGSYHVIDPETGVALVFGSQLIPSPDPEAAEIWKATEEAFYGGLI
ncbi:hypothetical protein C0991_007651 [Blastosporella zonata]|nr:hypothetical protein C0991_007651 [Blastosporella zonata]